MKTPKQLAELYSNEECEGNVIYRDGLYNGFLTGFKAGSQRTDAELIKTFYDIRATDSFGAKLATFINGLRKGLKQIKEYNENT